MFSMCNVSSPFTVTLFCGPWVQGVAFTAEIADELECPFKYLCAGFDSLPCPFPSFFPRKKIYFEKWCVIKKIKRDTYYFTLQHVFLNKNKATFWAGKQHKEIVKCYKLNVFFISEHWQNKNKTYWNKYFLSTSVQSTQSKPISLDYKFTILQYESSISLT